MQFEALPTHSCGVNQFLWPCCDDKGDGTSTDADRHRARGRRWQEAVCCAIVEECTSKEAQDKADPSSYFILEEDGTKKGVKMTALRLSAPPVKVLEKDLEKRIFAYQEIRQSFWNVQPNNFITYHAFTILEVEASDLFILLEKKSDKMELMLGYGNLPLVFMKEFRATGHPRNLQKCSAQPRQSVDSAVTVRQFIEWIDAILQTRWRPYNLLWSNCQHFASEVQQFVMNPRESELEAITVDPMELKVAPGVLRDDRNFVQQAVEMNPHALRYASSEIKRDRKIALAAVTQKGCALQETAAELRHDQEIVLTAVQQDGDALRYASPALKGDRDIVLAAVQQNGLSLYFATPELRGDREIAFVAVRQNGDALQYASEELRNSWSVVLAAVRQKGGALRYTSDDLRRDRKIVLEAVRQDGMALGLAADEMREDRTVVLAAIRNNPAAVRYASPVLSREPAVLVAVGWRDPLVLRELWGLGAAIEPHADSEPVTTSPGQMLGDSGHHEHASFGPPDELPPDFVARLAR